MSFDLREKLYAAGLGSAVVEPLIEEFAETIANGVSGGSSSFADLTGLPTDNTALAEALASSTSITSNKYTTIVAVGDSVTASTSTGGWVDAMCINSNGNLYMVNNAAVGGRTTQQMIDGFAAEVDAFPSDEIWIQAGTNDVGVLTNAAFGVKLNTLIDLAKATGRVVRVFNIPPKDTNIASALAFRKMIPLIARGNNVHFYDLWSETINPATGAFNTEDTTDGIHPSAAGHLKAVAKGMTLLGISTVNNLGDLIPSTNAKVIGLLDNPLFALDTNSDGVPDEWGLSGSSAVKTTTLVDGVYKMTVTNDAAGGDAATQNNYAEAVVIPGNRYAFIAKIKTYGDNFLWNSRLRWVNAASQSTGDTYLLQGRVPVDGYIYLEGVAPTTSANGAATRVAFHFRLSRISGTYSGSIEISEVQIYDLTALGLS